MAGFLRRGYRQRNCQTGGGLGARSARKRSSSRQITLYPGIVASWDAGYDAVLRGAPAMVMASAPEPRSQRHGESHPGVVLSGSGCPQPGAGYLLGRPAARRPAGLAAASRSHRSSRGPSPPLPDDAGIPQGEILPACPSASRQKSTGNRFQPFLKLIAPEPHPMAAMHKN